MFGAGISLGCKSSPQPQNPTAEETVLTNTPQATAQAPDAEQSEQDVAYWTKKADEAIAGEQWEAASAAFTQALELRPNDWELYLDRAIVESKQPDFLSAIADIERAMELGGKRDWRTWFNLGNIYQNRGLYAESVEAYRVAIGLQDRPHLPTLLNLASGYTFLRDFDAARTTLEYVLGLSPSDPRALHNLALLEHMQRKFTEALEGYQMALDADPTFAQSHFNRADVLAELQRYEEAAAAYERYIELDPDGPYVVRARRRAKSMRQRAY